MRTFDLSNGGLIQSLGALEGLENLERFTFYETTNIVDGDLSPIFMLPNLRSVAFQERRHYSHKRADFVTAGVSA